MHDGSKPIKRSEQLAPYSREHHEGLKLASRIKQGLAKDIDASRVGAYVHWFWELHLEPHFRSEENLLQPLLPQDDPYILQMMDEHEELEALVHINAQIADATLLSRFSEMLNAHIRFEERVLFPHIEAAASKEQLDQVLQLHGDEISCEAWKDPFWMP